MEKKDIDKDTYYSARQISLSGLLPWKSPYTFNKKLNTERWQEVFKPIVEQHTTSKTYKIKGENVINFLKALEEGNAQI